MILKNLKQTIERKLVKMSGFHNQKTFSINQIDKMRSQQTNRGQMTVPSTPLRRHALLIALEAANSLELGLFIFVAEQYLADNLKFEKKAKLIVEWFLNSDSKYQINSNKQTEVLKSALLLAETDKAEELLKVLIKEQYLSLVVVFKDAGQFKKMQETQKLSSNEFVKAVEQIKNPLKEATFDPYLMGVW